MNPAAVLRREQSADTEEEAKKTSINLRLSHQIRELIDCAAAVLGKSRTEFMLESARQHAIDVLLDQRIFDLEPKKYQAFLEALHDPPRANAKLKALFAGRSPWEKSQE